MVSKQVLRNILRCKKNDPRLYDTRNALRLCDSLDGKRCHMNMEWGNGTLRVSTRKLTDDNIAYAFEVMGDWAADYLRQQYVDEPQDPRILQLESRLRETA